LSLPAPFNAATAALNSDAVAGAPADQKLGVYVWAVDRYRKGYPRLAYAPAGSVENPGAWRYLTGVDAAGAPRWDTSAAAARPVFDTGDPSPGCIGEMHVSWVAPLDRWVMLYNCLVDEASGLSVVRARTATAPWGPWSEPTEIFHPGTDGGWCRFIHKPRMPACDRLGADNLSPALTAAEGSPYGPYVLDRFTRATPDGAEITFLLSTWNPYQVVVMRTVLSA
jgi:hypothetical protein